MGFWNFVGGVAKGAAISILESNLNVDEVDYDYDNEEANDKDEEKIVYTTQTWNGYGKQNDVFLGISTSGNSKNIIYAAITAKAKDMKIIGLTGEKNNELERYSDVCIKVPEIETFKVQELHLPVYHCLCLMLEDYYFGEHKTF